MKNKKKQFESLKNKLKNLYFKKALNVEKRQNAFKLLIEKTGESLNLSSPVEKVKRETLFLSNTNIPNVTKNIVKNIKNYIVSPKDKNVFAKNTSSKFITHNNIVTKSDNQNHINNIVTKSDNQNHINNIVTKSDNQNHINNIVTKSDNVTLNNVKKSILSTVDKNASTKNTSSKFISHNNITKSDNQNHINNIATNNENNTIVNNIEKSIVSPDLSGTVNNAIQSPSIKEKVVNNEKTIVKTNSINRQGYNISSPTIKFIETPEQIKNIRLNQIYNTRSLDTNQFYFPSKVEFVSLKNLIQNKKDENLSVVNNPTRISNNNTTQNNSETTIVKNKVLYALPAYKEGSDVVKSDIIAKIHKNEMVLSEKQVKSMRGENSGVVKADSQPDLTPKKYTPNVSSPFNSTKEHEKTLMSVPSLPDVPSEDDENSQYVGMYRMNDAVELNAFDKNFNAIKENLKKPLYLDSDQKNRSLPVWRATLG